MNHNPRFDKIYETQRNKLIDSAMEYANDMAGEKPVRATPEEYDEYYNVWNLAFHTRMDALAVEAGLV